MKKLNNICAIMLVVMLLAGGCVAGVCAYEMASWEEEFYEKYSDAGLSTIGAYDAYSPWFLYYQDNDETYYNYLLALYTELQRQHVLLAPSLTPTNNVPDETTTITENGFPVLPVVVVGVVIFILIMGVLIIGIRRNNRYPVNDPLYVRSEQKIDDERRDVDETYVVLEETGEELVSVEPVYQEPGIETSKSSAIQVGEVSPSRRNPKEYYAMVVEVLTEKYVITSPSSLTPRQLLEVVDPTEELTEFVKLYELSRYSTNISVEYAERLLELTSIILNQYSI